MANPFMPGNGIEPRYLAGRDSYLQEFAKSLRAFTNGLPRNLLLYGLRGTGKTVLLRRFKLIDEADGWITAEREFNERFCDENAFAEAFARDIVSLAAQVSIKKKLAEAGKRIAGLIKPEEIGAYGITYKPFYKEKKELLEDYLKELLISNWQLFKRASKKGVVLLYDEFHTVKDRKETKNFPLASLLGALSYAQRNGCRYYLVLSGLPMLKTNLKEAKTYTERMFLFREIGNLHPEDAENAVYKTLKGSGYEFSDDLVQTIVNETNGYPYFVQFYGYFLIEHAKKKRMSKGDLDRLKDKLLSELDASFFEDRFNLASEKEKKILMAMAEMKKDECGAKGIRKKAGVSHAVLMELLKRLTDKGLVYRVARGKYAFSIPLFRDFILRRL